MPRPRSFSPLPNLASEATPPCSSENAMDSRPHFFKVFFACHSSKRLAIPSAFRKHMELETSGCICLKGPSGNVWNVDLAVDKDGGMAFQNGWEDFARQHSLSTGDFLVFRYDGGLLFTVLVFEPTACEKEESFRVRPCQEQGMDAEGGVAFPSGSMARRKKPVLALPAFPEGHTCSAGKLSKERAQVDDGNLHTSDHAGGKKVPPGTVESSRRDITEHERARTRQAAESFQSKRPFGLSVMRPSYVYYGFFMYLPSSFTEHLPKSSTKITLWDPCNKPWEVTYIYTKGKGAFSGGWCGFSRANNLQSDDVCVFELLKPREVRVHIFRVVNEISPVYKGKKR